MPENQLLSDTYFAKREVLLGFLIRLCGDASMADDVMQDLYLRIHDSDMKDDIVNPLAFLFRMANNLYLNRRRSLASQIARDTAWHGLHVNAIAVEADMAPSAENIVAARQELRFVLQTIEGLPEKTQTIFRLHKLEGLMQAQVARQLNISISSVEKHLSRVLKHLTDQERNRKNN